jgi:hypothetical protein
LSECLSRKCSTRRWRNTARDQRTRCFKCRQRAWRKAHPELAAFHNLKAHARSRGIEFTISFEYFERFARKSRLLERRGLHGAALTVDRMDNLRGYVVGNIQPLTRSANSYKRAVHDAIRMSAGMAWQEMEVAA